MYKHIIIDIRDKDADVEKILKIEFTSEKELKESDIDWSEVKNMCPGREFMIYKLNISCESIS